MGHYARGDSTKMICSSDEEEGYRTASQHSSRRNSVISQMNFFDKRHFMFGTFGEAPPVPRPPVSDETDRQFWAEDELSSSESRILMNSRRKRKHSVAYRNRAAIHRSQSGFLQSSSSSTEPARLNIPPSVRRRRRLRNGPGTSRVQRPRVSSSVAHPKINIKTVSRSVAAGNDLASNCDIVQPSGRDHRFQTSLLSSQRTAGTDAARSSQSTNNPSRTPSKSDTYNVRRNRISKLRLLTKSRRK